MKSHKFRKYKINTISMVFSLMMFGLFTILFVVFLILSIKFNAVNVGEKVYSIFLIIKDMSLVGSTVFGSSIISTLLIDKKTKEFEYFSNVVNEIVCDKSIFNVLSDKNKQLLESQLYECDNETQIEIIRDVVNKIKQFNYYYEECSVNVSCFISKKSCKKTISKELRIKSFDNSVKIDRYRIHSSATRENADSYLSIKSISLDGKLLSRESYIIRREKINTEERVLMRNGYKSRFVCELIEPITFRSDRPTIIVVEYETVVSDDDSFTNRLPGPCKNYRLSFGVTDEKHSKYDITGSAFGFMEKGLKTPNIEENRFEIKFDTWSFKDDGVTLSYKKLFKKSN